MLADAVAPGLLALRRAERDLADRARVDDRERILVRRSEAAADVGAAQAELALLALDPFAQRRAWRSGWCPLTLLRRRLRGPWLLRDVERYRTRWRGLSSAGTRPSREGDEDTCGEQLLKH